MTIDNPLAALERLAEIEREHAKAGPAWATYCRLEGGLWPCHAIQLARAVRALVDGIRRLEARVLERGLINMRADILQPDLHTLFRMIAAAAPSREGEA